MSAMSTDWELMPCPVCNTIVYDRNISTSDHIKFFWDQRQNKVITNHTPVVIVPSEPQSEIVQILIPTCCKFGVPFSKTGYRVPDVPPSVPILDGGLVSQIFNAIVTHHESVRLYATSGQFILEYTDGTDPLLLSATSNTLQIMGCSVPYFSDKTLKKDLDDTLTSVGDWSTLERFWLTVFCSFMSGGNSDKRNYNVQVNYLTITIGGEDVKLNELSTSQWVSIWDGEPADRCFDQLPCNWQPHPDPNELDWFKDVSSSDVNTICENLVFALVSGIEYNTQYASAIDAANERVLDVISTIQNPPDESITRTSQWLLSKIQGTSKWLPSDEIMFQDLYDHAITHNHNRLPACSTFTLKNSSFQNTVKVRLNRKNFDYNLK